MPTAVQTNISAAEYLEMEKVSKTKHEFIYGNLFEMPGTTILHGRTIKRFCRVMDTSLHINGFESFTTDLKVEAEEGGVFFYPDIIIAKESLQKEDSYFIQQPVLIAEVLSPSTRTYDSTDKFIQYRKIESLQYYLLIETEQKLIVFYEKDSIGEWQSEYITEEKRTLHFPVLSASISLSEIYQD